MNFPIIKGSLGPKQIADPRLLRGLGLGGDFLVSTVFSVGRVMISGSTQQVCAGFVLPVILCLSSYIGFPFREVLKGQDGPEPHWQLRTINVVLTNGHHVYYYCPNEGPV